MDLTSLHRFPLVEHIVHGERASLVVPRELERLGKNRVFLVTTSSVARSGLLAPLVEKLGTRLVLTSDTCFALCRTFLGAVARALRNLLLQTVN